MLELYRLQDLLQLQALLAGGLRVCLSVLSVALFSLEALVVQFSVDRPILGLALEAQVHVALQRLVLRAVGGRDRVWLLRQVVAQILLVIAEALDFSFKWRLNSLSRLEGGVFAGVLPLHLLY